MTDKYTEFCKELAQLLDKYREDLDGMIERQEDKWISMRVPYQFMLGDQDFAYEHHLYVCDVCGVQDYTQDKLENNKCEFCDEGIMTEIIMNDINDWVNYPK